MATGLIQEKMARPQGNEITPESVDSKIKVPAELQEAYEKVVVAGMKIMYSKESHRVMLEEIKRPGPMGERLGKGITGLMLLMIKESNNTMPPAVVIPAGIKLMMEAVDFLRKTGIADPTNEEIGQGMETFISMILQQFGADPAKLEGALSQFSNDNIPAAPEAASAAPAAPMQGA
jgi:hypothetical protein